MLFHMLYGLLLLNVSTYILTLQVINWLYWVRIKNVCNLYIPRSVIWEEFVIFGYSDTQIGWVCDSFPKIIRSSFLFFLMVLQIKYFGEIFFISFHCFQWKTKISNCIQSVIFKKDCSEVLYTFKIDFTFQICSPVNFQKYEQIDNCI